MKVLSRLATEFFRVSVFSAFLSVLLWKMRMEKDKAPIIRGIILSFDPGFYPVVLRQSSWRSFLYLGVICLLVYGFLGYRAASVGFDLLEQGASEFYDEALPQFSFEDGKADYPPDKPHVYEKKTEGKVFAVVVDTSGKSEHLDGKYRAGLLITKTEIVAKDLKGKEERQPIPDTAEEISAKDYFVDRVREQRTRVIFAETADAFLLHLAGKLLLVALVAGVLLFADGKRKNSYPFSYYFNVACYSVTPFVLSALVRAWDSGSFLSYASYGASLMMFLLLTMLGLARCRQEDAREAQYLETPQDSG